MTTTLKPCWLITRTSTRRAVLTTHATDRASAVDGRRPRGGRISFVTCLARAAGFAFTRACFGVFRIPRVEAVA